MNIVNAVFTCFLGGRSAVEGQRGRDGLDAFVKRDLVPGFHKILYCAIKRLQPELITLLPNTRIRLNKR